MTGFTSKRKMAQDRLDDDDIQVYAKPSIKRPIESDYASQVAYTRALEMYCDSLAQPDYRAVKTYHEGKPVYVSQPVQDWSWVCNECGAREFTSALSETDLEHLACSECGSDEFHKVLKEKNT